MTSLSWDVLSLLFPVMPHCPQTLTPYHMLISSLRPTMSYVSWSIGLFFPMIFLPTFSLKLPFPITSPSWRVPRGVVEGWPEPSWAWVDSPGHPCCTAWVRSWPIGKAHPVASSVLCVHLASEGTDSVEQSWEEWLSCQNLETIVLILLLLLPGRTKALTVVEQEPASPTGRDDNDQYDILFSNVRKDRKAPQDFILYFPELTLCSLCVRCMVGVCRVYECRMRCLNVWCMFQVYSEYI